MARLWLLLLLCVAVVPAQYWPGRQSNGRKYDGPETMLFKFEGIVKGVSKKDILLELEHEQTLRFRIAKEMRLYDGEKPAKEKMVGAGWMIVIEARREPNGDLTAMILRIVERSK